MNKTVTRHIGTLTKLYSFKGRYVLISERNIGKEIQNWESVFLEIEGLLVPFFFNFMNITSDNSAIIGFEDIDTPEKAEAYLYSNVYQLKSLAGEYKAQLIPEHMSGYDVNDKIAGNIGKIDKILDYKHNLLFRIIKGEKEILIPLSEEIILDINHKKKEILIQAPEGLLDLNE
jgi:16S rRNA processing protein RimM